MYNPFSLEGKTILVTGASSGIGRATAVECSKLGAKLVLTARNESRLRDTLDLLEGGGHRMILADLTNQSDIDNLVSELPEMDGLVNDAGIGKLKPISFLKRNDLDEIFSINMYAPILLTSAILKKKKMRNGSSIVMVSSGATVMHAPGNSVYGASKAAIKTFAEFCAVEYKNRGIRVNSVHPGMVNTEMTKNPPLSNIEENKDRERYILKRYGAPEEVAWCIVYLLSDATKWVTGTQLLIDGGGHLA